MDMDFFTKEVKLKKEPKVDKVAVPEEESVKVNEMKNVLTEEKEIEPERTEEEVYKGQEQKRDKKKGQERKAERGKVEVEVAEYIDGKQAVISAKTMLATIDANPGLSEEHKQSLKEMVLRNLVEFFKNKRIVFDEESYKEFEKLEYKDLLLKVVAFKDAVEEFNSPERKLKDLLKEYENIKGLLSKVAFLEEKLREVLVSIEGLKVRVENMDGSLNDRISKLEARIEDTDRLRKEIEEIVREYVEIYKPDVEIDEKWIEERVLKILHELEMQVGTDESAIRDEIEKIVREEIEKAVSQLQIKREEEKSEEEPRVEMLKETEIKSNVVEEQVQEKPKKKSLIAGVPDIVVYIVVALGLIFFVMQLIG